MINSFSLSSSEGGYGIYADINCEEWTDLYFDMDTADPAQKTRMKLSSWGVNGLKESLDAVMDLFEEWESIANSNSMGLLTKRMPLKMDTQDIIFTENQQWNLAESVKLFVTFFVAQKGKCYAILQTEQLKSKEIISKAFSYSSAVSPNGRWNLSWSRSETTLFHYGNEAFIVFEGRKDVDCFIGKLKESIKWIEHNRLMGELLVRTKKK